MSVVAVAGRKGGIGKSTIVGNLAGEFSQKGRKVVVIDADPQHSLVAWAEQGDGLLRGMVRKVDKGDPAALKFQVRKVVGEDADLVLIDTPPGMPETAYAAAMVADLVLLPCGPSPLDLFALKEALKLALRARAIRRAKLPRIRLVPSKVLMSTNLGRSLTASLEGMGRKVLPPVGQRIVLAEAVSAGLTIAEYAPNSPAHDEFAALAKAIDKILKK
jgi:chromosome partitioning protein